MGYRGLDSSGSRQGQVVGSCGHGKGLLSFIKFVKFRSELFSGMYCRVK
jgi:hypothetical protein